MKKYIIIIFSIVLIFVIIGVTVLLFVNPVSLSSQNEKDFKQTIIDLPAETKNVFLEEIIPFEWDYMYSFEPYVSSSEIEEIIGFQSSQITGTDNENLEQLLFVKNNEVVCNIIGYPENLKFCFYFLEMENRYIKIHKSESVQFQISIKDEIKEFTQVAQ